MGSPKTALSSALANAMLIMYLNRYCRCIQTVLNKRYLREQWWGVGGDGGGVGSDGGGISGDGGGVGSDGGGIGGDGGDGSDIGGDGGNVGGDGGSVGGDGGVSAVMCWSCWFPFTYAKKKTYIRTYINKQRYIGL